MHVGGTDRGTSMRILVSYPVLYIIQYPYGDASDGPLDKTELKVGSQLNCLLN